MKGTLLAWTCWASSLSLSLGELAYPLGCSTKSSNYYDFESALFPPATDVPIKSNEDYMLVRRLGAGKFSDVFESVDVLLDERLRSAQKKQTTRISIDPRTLVVLKCLKPVAERKIKRELLILQHASKLPNLARLLAIVIPSDYQDSAKKYHLQNMPALVLEHAGVDSQWFCHPSDEKYLTDEQIQYFLFHLLVALDHLHAAGIMVRCGCA
jgi:casein kinase II subunit alpha